jgi:hypothetical protein
MLDIRLERYSPPFEIPTTSNGAIEEKVSLSTFYHRTIRHYAGTRGGCPAGYIVLNRTISASGDGEIEPFRPSLAWRSCHSLQADGRRQES